MSGKGLFAFSFDSVENGVIDSVFVADVSEVEEAVGKQFHIDEFQGDQINRGGIIQEGDIRAVDVDEFVVDSLGDDFSDGPNPLNYLV